MQSFGETAMADYRCYFVDSLNKIHSATELHCAEDAEAMLQADALARSRCLSAEIWNGARLVGRVPTDRG
jgi:hypothetical protein